MTRGATRSIQFSSRFDRGIKLHRTNVNFPRLEALRGRSRFFAIGGVVWMLSDRTILIGWLSITPISFHCGDAWNPPDRWISIGRQRIVVEEPHDRGAIEPRSHSFQRGIDPTGPDGGRPSSRIAIDTRSGPDRGAIIARLWWNRGQI